MENYKEIAMQRYDTYKDNGVYFFPDLPANWEIRKAKYLFKEENRPVKPDDEIVTCFRDGQVTLRKNRRVEGFTNSLKEIGYQGVRKGDLVIHNMDAFAGSIGISDSDGKATPVYSCCTPISSEVNQFYYCYLLRFLARNGFILSLAKGIRERSTDFRFNDFKELYLPLPSREEQDAIVNHINTVTAKIDAAIAQQQKMIDLLNERKQIIINCAVTKGLNPNAKMKDSGVEWIGEVPEHWEVRRLKTLFNYISRGITPNYVEQSNCRVVNQATFSKGFFDRDNQRFTVAMEYNDSFVRNGDILMASTGGGVLGKVYYFEGQEENNVADSHVTIIRTNNKEVNGKFYYYLFSTQYDMINAVMAKGSTNQTELQRQELTSLFVPVSTRKEQDEIVKHLDTLSEQIETIIVQYRNQISLLQERKQIVINDVVTGKVKVG